jgi:hypothetical protein
MAFAGSSRRAATSTNRLDTAHGALWRLTVGSRTDLKIMVSPVRIRVLPLKKVLQNSDKCQGPAHPPELCGNSRLRKRSCNGIYGGILHVVCGVRIDGKGHANVGVPEHLLSDTRMHTPGGERGGKCVP